MKRPVSSRRAPQYVSKASPKRVRRPDLGLRPRTASLALLDSTSVMRWTATALSSFSTGDLGACDRAPPHSRGVRVAMPGA